MPNYNSQLQSNNTDLQTVLQALQTKAAGGEQATPEISVNTSGLITATAGVKSATYQLAFQPAKTITPSTASQIAVSSGYYTGGNVTVDGDSNLVPENIKSGVSIFGVSGTLEESSGSSGDTNIEDNFVTRNISSSYTNNRVSEVGEYVFYYADDLRSVNFPACTSIGKYAFNSCHRLASISFPVCVDIGLNAFANCFSLTLVSFPVCTSLATGVFANCYSLTSVSFPVCTFINNGTFIRCSRLISANFPACSGIYTYAFENCHRLASVSFPVCSRIYTGAFANCRLLSSLYLANSATICTLFNSDTFTSTPYAGYSASFSGIPYIYVPSSLINSYKTATNWTYFSSYFSAIEDAPDWDGTYGDNSGNQSSGGNQDGGHSGGGN